MKRFYIILLVILSMACSSYAQHYIGAKAGYGMTRGRFYPRKEMKSVWGMYNGGVAWKYYTDQKFVGGVGVELEFLQRGFEYEMERMPDTTYRRTVNSIVMPIMWQPHVYLFNQKTRVFVNLAFTINYNFNSREDTLSRRDGVIYSGKYDMRTVRDVRWGYGLFGGFGIGYLHEKWEFMIEARYYFGYADILRHTSKYPGNPRRSPIDNVTISAGFFYRLGQGGLLVQPSNKTLQRQQEKQFKKDNKRLANGNDTPAESS